MKSLWIFLRNKEAPSFLNGLKKESESKPRYMTMVFDIIVLAEFYPWVTFQQMISHIKRL
ncbi:hypothetical protein L584_08105 [Pantoea agglomerans Tx10]|nr:hypothetical protein L584_08105 [Pantoea agglomerans Tx10]